LQNIPAFDDKQQCAMQYRKEMQQMGKTFRKNNKIFTEARFFVIL
jgi:hypothetical protein